MTGGGTPGPRTRRYLVTRGAGIAGGILVASLALGAAALAQEVTTLRVGFTAPLTGSFGTIATSGQTAAELGLATLDLPGIELELVPLDGAVDGLPDAAKGARDIAALVADPSVVAVIGPYNTLHAQAQIPVSSEAGLVQCGVTVTNPAVTVGPEAAALRSPRAPGNAFVRVIGTDDLLSVALARYAWDALGIRSVAVLDDDDPYGVGVADGFTAAWEPLGGTVAGRWSLPGRAADHAAVVTEIAATGADAVLFGGSTATGAALLRVAMAEAGLGDIPFLSGGLVDGTGDDPGSFLGAAGAAAAQSWSADAALPDGPGGDAFQRVYRERTGADPAAYAQNAYACAEIIVAAIERIAAGGPVTREAVRATVTDPAMAFPTVLGPISFDAHGDLSVRAASLYRADLTIDADPAQPGTGDWLFVERIEAGR